MGAHSKPGVRPVLALAEQALVDPHGLCVTKLQPPESADMPTHRGLPAQVPTTIRPAAIVPLTAPRVVGRSHSRRGRALGYRTTQTSADERSLRLVFCSSETGLNRPVFSFDHFSVLTDRAAGLVMRRPTARFPPGPRRSAQAGRATSSGPLRVARWPARGVCASRRSGRLSAACPGR